MKKIYCISAVILLLSGFATKANAQQSTYQKVYGILNANCTGAGCHSGGPGNAQSGLDFSLADTAVYTQIINKIPVNPAAAAANNKIINPGYPQTSFLLRKIANCSEPDLALSPSEGLIMPKGRPALPDSSVEVIRQWIIQAAPKLGVVVDTALIAKYYGGPHMPRTTPPAPPLPCEGFQIHLGPLFFDAGQESEYFKRYDLNNTDALEVNRLDLNMNLESHHFIIRKYNAGTANNYTQALVPLSVTSAFDQNKNYVMAWQNNRNIALPNGTAYKWEANASVDLNYHVHNYDSLPLAVDMYLNVYTQPSGTAQLEMKSVLINELIFNITPHDTTTFSYDVFNNTNASIWSITAHTHKTGVKYNVWLDKPGNVAGDLIYNGDYDFDYQFNQGYFDWHHPPTHFIEPMLYTGDKQSDGSSVTGLKHQAKYYNFTNNTINFGFTTADEMMIIYIQYVDGRYNIPAQGYVNPNCLAAPYANPCSGSIIDTSHLIIGDIINSRSGNVTLSSSDSGTAALGDTVSVTSGGKTIVFVITGANAPYKPHVGDVILVSSNGTVYLNGIAIGYLLNSTNGIIETAAPSLAEFNVYPNPFESNTNIQYGLTSNATVNLEVYNLLGKRITQIVGNEKQVIGLHQYDFSAANMSSGVYLVKLTIDGVTTVKKVSVL